MKRDIHFKFRLFVAGESENSVQAVANLRTVCSEFPQDCCAIEIVDVLRDPATGLKERVFMTPTLIIESPPPVRRIIGNLSNIHTQFGNLGIAPPEK